MKSTDLTFARYQEMTWKMVFTPPLEEQVKDKHKNLLLFFILFILLFNDLDKEDGRWEDAGPTTDSKEPGVQCVTFDNSSSRRP